jgi:hypothetical protein
VNNLGVLLGLAFIAFIFVVGVFAAATHRLALVIRLVGAALALGATSIVLWGVVAVYRRGFVDLNPRVIDADIVGRWNCDFGVLSLQASGAFSLTGSETWSGHWSRHDWALLLGDETPRKEYWRVVTFSGTPVLLCQWRDPASRMPPECRKSGVREQAVQQ